MNQQEMFEVAQQDRIKAKNEALKMAIEAMLKEPQSMEDFEFKERAINACKEALEL